MPLSVKLMLAFLMLTLIAIPFSIAISFIYANQQLLIFILAYLLLWIWFSCYVIYEHNVDKKSTQKMRNQKWPVFVIFLLFPWFVADTLVFLTPVMSEVLASKFQIREYTVIKVEPYAKSFRHLSKLYVADIHKNETSFVIKDKMLDNLKIRINDKLVVSGRNCFAGFVVDSINGTLRR